MISCALYLVLNNQLNAQFYNYENKMNKNNNKLMFALTLYVFASSIYGGEQHPGHYPTTVLQSCEALPNGEGSASDGTTTCVHNYMNYTPQVHITNTGSEAVKVTTFLQGIIFKWYAVSSITLMPGQSGSLTQGNNYGRSITISAHSLTNKSGSITYYCDGEYDLDRRFILDDPDGGTLYEYTQNVLLWDCSPGYLTRKWYHWQNNNENWYHNPSS